MSDRPEFPPNTSQSITWSHLGRIILKAALLFSLLNALFAFVQPLESLGRLSIYNWLVPGRLRLPYGEEPDKAYNLSLNNLPAMMASQAVDRPREADEFRVLILGDSGTWGWLLKNEDTLAGQITAGDYRAADGRQVVAYNLGYPIMSLTKDLLLLDTAMAVEPDLIIWPVTLHSFLRDKQLDPPIVHENPERMRHLINEYSLGLNPEASSFIEPDFLGRTIVGQRRALADLLRLQLYGFSWAATSIDQVYPEEIDLRTSDFEDDESWLSFEESVLLSDEDLVFDILAAGVVRAGEVPLLIVNEPIFVSSGQNSHIRYNAWYPRWAYDRYREMLDNLTKANNWDYLDLWDLVSPEQFTDSPVHLTPDGVAILSKTIIDFRFSLTKRLRSNTAD